MIAFANTIFVDNQLRRKRVSVQQFQRAKDKTEAREQYFADLKRKFEDIQKNVGSQIPHPATPFLVLSYLYPAPRTSI
jgi:hypothetical protein